MLFTKFTVLPLVSMFMFVQMKISIQKDKGINAYLSILRSKISATILRKFIFDIYTN